MRAWLRRTQAIAPHSVLRPLNFRPTPDSRRRQGSAGGIRDGRYGQRRPFQISGGGAVEEQSQQVDVSDLAHSGYKQELRFAHSLEWATGVDCGPAAPAWTRDGGRTLAFGTAWITT